MQERTRREDVMHMIMVESATVQRESFHRLSPYVAARDDGIGLDMDAVEDYFVGEYGPVVARESAERWAERKGRTV